MTNRTHILSNIAKMAVVAVIFCAGTGFSYAQSPALSKEYIYLNNHVVAIENQGLADLRDDGFESGDLSGWTVANGSDAHISTSWAHTGNDSIVESGPVNSGVTQDIAGLIPGQEYTISAWVDVASGAAAALYVDDTINSSSTVAAYQGVSNGWQLISLPFIADSTGKVRIHLWVNQQGTIYWDDVSVVAAMPMGNYGFESGNLSTWTIFNGSNAAVTGAWNHSGNYSILESGPVNSGVMQDITGLTPGQQYTITAWADVRANAIACLVVNDTQNSSSATSLIQGQTAGWQPLSLVYTADSTGRARIYLNVVASGTVYWDDVSIVAGIPVLSDGFESGNLSYWTVENGSNAAISTIWHSGTYTAVESGPVNSGISQVISGLTPGQTYIVSAWANVGGGATAALYLDDAVNSSTSLADYQSQSSGWQFMSVPFTANDTGELRIHLWVIGSGTIYWDDVSVVH